MKRGVITLYVRAACPLCEEAEATLRALVAEQGVERIDIVDIESDASLHQRFVAVDDVPPHAGPAAVDDRENGRAVTR